MSEKKKKLYSDEYKFMQYTCLWFMFFFIYIFFLKKEKILLFPTLSLIKYANSLGGAVVENFTSITRAARKVCVSKK